MPHTSPVPPTFDAERALALARETFDIEAQALLGLKARQGDGFAAAVRTMLGLQGGRVVVMGMGKSGHVGRKIAATLASTGTPALFVHPAEASHGDLGMITGDDVVLLLSNSGETPELADLIAYTRRFAIPLVGSSRSPTQIECVGHTTTQAGSRSWSTRSAHMLHFAAVWVSASMYVAGL